MLTSLSIKNVVLIDQLTIEFKGGFCALTGETGAGKSILLDSLGLALGARSEASLVRNGAEQAQVSASFDVGDKHPALAILRNAGLESDTTLILRRAVGSDGRSKAYINDQPVSIGLLREVGDTLVEIHSQFETQGLLDPSTHRAMLDDYAGIGGGLPAVFAAWKDELENMSALRAEAEKSKAEENFLRQSLEDLDGLEPKAGEEQELAALRERLMHREQVLEALNAAYNTLNGEDDPVRKAWGALDRIAAKIGPAGDAITGALGRATSEIQEAIAAIESVSADLQEGDHNLQSIDDRLFSLRAQARKHGCGVDGLSAMRDDLARRLNMIQHADDALAAQMKKVEQARKSYEALARKVSEARQKAADKLDRLVAKELPPLKLEKARFVTEIAALAESEWGPHGMDRVRFLVATNPGAAPGPLNKIASGGEMARFMLALKVVTAQTGAAGTLVFDEVDSGIGGATASAVGERLARLAAGRQVLVVTHAPQVAARAGNHWIVLKDGKKDVTTKIIPLAEVVARQEEIARMLSGAEVTQEARAAAKRLIG